MSSDKSNGERVEPFVVRLDDVEQFDRPGFAGFEQLSITQGLGFSALTIHVNGEHPRKRILDGTRAYYVAEAEDGSTFTIGDDEHPVKEGDLFVVPEGGEYNYQGRMALFEVNVPSANSSTGKVEDLKLDQ